MTKSVERGDGAAESASGKPVPPAARRALAEAEARRRARQERQEREPPPPREIDGRGGLDPVRYGDWEIKGLICDF